MPEAKPEPRQSRASFSAASASGCLDSLRLVELYVLTRHGESTLNFENRINGDPTVPVALTAKGREEALLLGQQVAHIRLDVCICTRFSRTRETAEIALAGRDGESLDGAARRYAQAFRKLLARSQTSVLVVTHEIPLRYAINAADGSDDLDGPAHQLPNATPYVFDEEALACAIDGIERVT